MISRRQYSVVSINFLILTGNMQCYRKTVTEAKANNAKCKTHCVIDIFCCLRWGEMIKVDCHKDLKTKYDKINETPAEMQPDNNKWLKQIVCTLKLRGVHRRIKEGNRRHTKTDSTQSNFGGICYQYSNWLFP